MKKLIIFIACILIISVGSNANSNITLTDEQAERLYNRLDKDEKIIKWQANRWKNFINATPNIKYEVIDDTIIIQTIEFLVKGDKPLIYEIKMQITKKTPATTYFPFTLSLCGIIESGVENNVDMKIGLQLISLAPVRNKFTRSIGIHFLLGSQSSGLSMSWKVPKYLKNTRIHIYSGVTYKLEKTFGSGISLDF